MVAAELRSLRTFEKEGSPRAPLENKSSMITVGRGTALRPSVRWVSSHLSEFSPVRSSRCFVSFFFKRTHYLTRAFIIDAGVVGGLVKLCKMSRKIQPFPHDCRYLYPAWSGFWDVKTADPSRSPAAPLHSTTTAQRNAAPLSRTAKQEVISHPHTLGHPSTL